MSRVASGLLSTVRVMGALPIIRYMSVHICGVLVACSCCILVVVVLTVQWQHLAFISVSYLSTHTHIGVPREARRRCSRRN
jgi:hypothetical protein